MGSISPVAGDAALSTPQTKTATDKSSDKSTTKSLAEFSANNDAVILDASLGTQISGTAKKDSGGDGFQELYKALSLTGKEIVDKINDQLKISLPEGVQSLKPEDVTPEATADRIVSGVTAFFDIYAKQKKGLSGDALVDSFISEVQKGVDEGYGDAFKFLEGIGAFNVDGVKDGIEKTRSLIDEKLNDFAVQKKKELSPQQPEQAPKVEPSTSAAINLVA